MLFEDGGLLENISSVLYSVLFSLEFVLVKESCHFRDSEARKAKGKCVFSLFLRLNYNLNQNCCKNYKNDVS